MLDWMEIVDVTSPPDFACFGDVEDGRQPLEVPRYSPAEIVVDFGKVLAMLQVLIESGWMEKICLRMQVLALLGREDERLGYAEAVERRVDEVKHLAVGPWMPILLCVGYRLERSNGIDKFIFQCCRDELV